MRWSDFSHGISASLWRPLQRYHVDSAVLCGLAITIPRRWSMEYDSGVSSIINPDVSWCENESGVRRRNRGLLSGWAIRFLRVFGPGRPFSEIHLAIPAREYVGGAGT